MKTVTVAPSASTATTSSTTTSAAFAPTVVVTGANGFIGTHIVEAFLKRRWSDVLQKAGRPKTASLRFSNFEEVQKSSDDVQPWADASIRVVGVDLPESLTRSNARRFAGSACYTFLSSEELLVELESGRLRPQLIIHNGACSSTVETDPNVFKKLNLDYSKALFAASAKLGIPFIYASSASVYGNGALGFSDLPSENTKLLPMNLYGKSKHDFDSWAWEQEQQPSSWYGLRYFNVYGPFESHKQGQASMVYHAYQQITRTGKVNLFKSGSQEYAHGMQVRDFIFVDDVVRYTLEISAIALRHKESSEQNPLPFLMSDRDLQQNAPVRQGVFVNLGTGHPRTWVDLVTAVFSALGLPPRNEFIDMPLSISGHDQNYTCAEHGGLRSLQLPLQFTPLEKGVSDYVRKFLARGL